MAKKTEDNEQSKRMQAVQVAVEQIQKQFGQGSIMKLGDQARQKISVIPSDILPLDVALGVGGVPRGRIVEVYGPEASGKTTVCLNFIAQVQLAGGIAAFVDAEHALDPTWAEILGVDLENLLISQPDTGEQALEIAEALIRRVVLILLLLIQLQLSYHAARLKEKWEIHRSVSKPALCHKH